MGFVKTCTKCGKTKPIEEFHIDLKKKDGHKGICKNCKHKYYEKHAEKRKEMNKIYCARYRQGIKEQERKLEAVELLQASEILGGYRIYVLNHCKEGEVKYTCVKVSTAEVYRTNDKRKFLDYLEGVI